MINRHECCRLPSDKSQAHVCLRVVTEGPSPSDGELVGLRHAQRRRADGRFYRRKIIPNIGL